VDKVSSEAEHAELKRALLRMATFLLVFLSTHWLFQVLHPMGAHRFFLNLALAALISLAAVRLIARRSEGNRTDDAHQQSLPH